MSVLLRLGELRKEYFGVPAVSGLSLDIRDGEVLGLIGENGAGKSTLMNMIGGVVPSTSGEMTWRGEAYQPQNAGDATARGIAFIHQELNLFTNLTVAENIFIDGFPSRHGLIDRRAIHARTQELLDRLKLLHHLLLFIYFLCLLCLLGLYLSWFRIAGWCCGWFCFGRLCWCCLICWCISLLICGRYRRNILIILNRLISSLACGHQS